MELNQLRYFMAVARTGSFSRAAEQCHVSQPSLSQQMMKLESELGETLFERLSRGVALTAAGRLLEQRAERILREVAAAEQEIQELGAVLRGRLTLGALPTIAPYFLPDLIRAFHAAWPQVQLIVHEETTARLTALVEEGELDAAIVSLPAPGAALHRELLFTEELLAALPAGHPLAKTKILTAAALQNEPFILMQEGHCLGDQALAYCAQRGDFQPSVSCRSTQVETIMSLVGAGLGVSLVPAMAAGAPPPDGVILRSLHPDPPRRAIAAIWRANKQFGRVPLEFIAFLRRHVTGRQKAG